MANSQSNERSSGPMANGEASKVKRLSPADVEAIAADLVRTYNNPDYEPWYCGVAYEFGSVAVYAWVADSAKAKKPGHFFTAMVNKERTKQQRTEVVRRSK